MTKNPLEFVIGSLADKKQWRAYKKRTAKLPSPYRETVAALEKYLWTFGETPTEWPLAGAMFDDVADLFERAAIDGTPVREIVGDDPVEFAETFARSYSDGGWLGKSRARLTAEIDRLTRGTS